MIFYILTRSGTSSFCFDFGKSALLYFVSFKPLFVLFIAFDVSSNLVFFYEKFSLYF